MTHVYKEYAVRIKEIDSKQKDVDSWLHGKDSVFADAAMNQQYPSIDKFHKAIHYYMRKNTNKPVELVTIEDALLFVVGYVKFIAVDDIAKLCNNEASSKKLIDGLYRIKKKGYVARTTSRNSRGKSYYALTPDGKEVFDNMVNERYLVPYSSHNYNNDGQPYHDCLVGNVFIRLLMLNIPFRYTRNYYIKGMKRKDDVYPDARIEILHSSRNKRIIYEEGDTGTEAVDVIIEKIGKYYFKQYCRNNKNNYVMFTHARKDNNFLGDNFPCLFMTDTKQLKIVYSLIEHYNCTLDWLIEKLEEYINSYRNNAIEFNQDIFKRIAGEESDDFTDYKITKCLLCAKAVRLLLSFEWIEKYLIGIKDKGTDIQKIRCVYEYFSTNKYNNGIQYYIDSMKNIEDTRVRRLSLVRGIVIRYDRIKDVWYMPEALHSILGGMETLFLPNCICEAYIPYYMEQESEQIFQKMIKNMIEKEFKHTVSYSQIGAPIKTINKVPDLYMRNCYYYIAENNQPVEIYVENISASLSAMVRVVTLVCELLGISVENRNCTVICMVDSIRDMQLFIKLLIWANKRYNAATDFKMPIYFLVYDEIKEGKLLSYDCAAEYLR